MTESGLTPETERALKEMVWAIARMLFALDNTAGEGERNWEDWKVQYQERARSLAAAIILTAAETYRRLRGDE